MVYTTIVGMDEYYAKNPRAGFKPAVNCPYENRWDYLAELTSAFKALHG